MYVCMYKDVRVESYQKDTYSDNLYTTSASQLYGVEYSYGIQIIFKQIYLTHIGITTPVQSNVGLGVTAMEELLHIL